MAVLAPNAKVLAFVVEETTPMIEVIIPARGVSGRMARIALRADVSEWRSAEGLGLRLKGGQIIATVGFGADLAIADAQGANEALRQGAGTYQRTLHWVDGENHDIAELFACTMRSAQDQNHANERKLSETCNGQQTTFTNTFTVSVETGGLIRSEQWISRGLGYIRIDHY